MRRRHVVHLDDQILAILRDQPAETARFVVMRLYQLPRHFLYSTVANRGYGGILDMVEGRIASLRRRGFVEAAGKSSRDRRQKQPRPPAEHLSTDRQSTQARGAPRRPAAAHGQGPAMTRAWTLDLPHGDYVTPNSRAHWSHVARCAREWRRAAMLLARAERIPALDRVEVTLTVTPKDRRRRDPDGFALVLKWATDGLVDAGVLPDDTGQQVAKSSTSMAPPDGTGRWRWRLTVREAPEVFATSTKGIRP